MINEFPIGTSWFAWYCRSNWDKQDADNQDVSNSKATERAQEQQGGSFHVEGGKEGRVSDNE